MEGVIYFLGSSVTFGSATDGVSFVEKIEEKLGVKIIKDAVSGTTLAQKGENSYVERLKTFSTENTVNRVIAQLSTNDITQNLPFGEVSKGFKASDFDLSTVLGAIEYIIAFVKINFDCEIIFYTNLYYKNDKYAKLVDKLYEIKAKWNIQIIDFYNFKNMPFIDEKNLNLLKADDIHPNEMGYEWMANVFIEHLKLNI